MNGKEKCNLLKTIRCRIAMANGIEYTPNECTHEGACLGTCPACEAEAEGLLAKLFEKELDGKPINIDMASLVELQGLAGTWDGTPPDPSDEDSDNEIAELGYVMTPGFIEGKQGEANGKLRGTLMGDIINDEDQLLGDI